MSTEATTLDIVTDPTAELAVVVQENRLPAEAAQSLKASFAPLFREAQSVLEKSRSITVTDASQKLEIKLARECRLELRRIRTTGDKLRKDLKDESLRRGRAIDGFQNILLHLTAEEEERLDAQEKFVENQERDRKIKLKLSRETALMPFGLDTSFMQLGEMPDETFAQLLENTRAGHEAKLAAERKAQEDRIRAENERLREEARIREENSRLQREAQEREAAARKEREEAAARLAAEQAAAAKAKKESEAAAKAQQEAAAAALQAERARLEAIAASERQKAAKAAEEAAEAARLEKLRMQAQVEIERQRAAKAQAEAEVKAAAERAAREKLEAEAAAAREVEAQKARAAAEAARQAALAPDRDKLLAVAAELRYLKVPKVTSEAAKDVVSELVPRITKLAVWLETEAARL